MVNPLLPTLIDVVWAGVLTAHVLLAGVALIVLVTRRRTEGLWGSILLITLVPVAGPVVWLASLRAIGGRSPMKVAQKRVSSRG